jgi:hypothetical protein
MRVGRSSSKVSSMKLKSAARMSAEAIRTNDDPRAAETFVQFFAQELRASGPPPVAPTSPPLFGTLAPRRRPRR